MRKIIVASAALVALSSAPALAAEPDFTFNVPVQINDISQSDFGFSVRCQVFDGGGQVLGSGSSARYFDDGSRSYSGIVTVEVDIGDEQGFVTPIEQTTSGIVEGLTNMGPGANDDDDTDDSSPAAAGAVSYKCGLRAVTSGLQDGETAEVTRPMDLAAGSGTFEVGGLFPWVAEALKDSAAKGGLIRNVGGGLTGGKDLNNLGQGGGSSSNGKPPKGKSGGDAPTDGGTKTFKR